MLKLRNIKKNYETGAETVTALKGVSLNFRENEFVCVLGPSGCGKTTLLNIIGGLDQYTSGDLQINGKSTKSFKDRDWDGYRNHSVGFVFQSYNLIPHQTVLANVELALTLSGVSRRERKRRAKQALGDVGLANQLRKKPAQMSGGQMQRVAIARALVNDPDIILADEPTGALDTETSISVMEILKKISEKRLVIMVTHNPELASRYATRIVRMLDGEIKEDSAPLSEKEIEELNAKDEENLKKAKKRVKLPSMSFFTSFSLSLKNLFTKRGRTALTGFAGSIGIIGIALIYAVSQGLTTYINTVQEDTLSSYPLTIESSNIDLGSLLSSMAGSAQAKESHGKDAVYVKEALADTINSINNLETYENDLKSFKAFIDSEKDREESPLHDALSGVKYNYALSLLVYTKNVDGKIIASDTTDLMRSMMAKFWGKDASSYTGETVSAAGSSTISSLFSSSASSSYTTWQEMLAGENGKPVSPLLEKQYDLVYGSWPNSYDEIVLVLDQNNELDDMTLYALGLISEDEINAIMDAAMNGTELSVNASSWSYEDICKMDFRVILNSACYSLDPVTGLYTDLRSTDAGLRYLYDNAIKLRVSGIIRPSEDAVSSMLTGSIGYTEALTEYVMNEIAASPAVLAQQNDKTHDIFSGNLFPDVSDSLTDAEKEKAVRDYLSSLSEKEKAEVYVKIMSEPSEEMTEKAIASLSEGLTREKMEADMASALAAQMSIDADMLAEYLAAMSDEELRETYLSFAKEEYKNQYAVQMQSAFSKMTETELALSLDKTLSYLSAAQAASYYDTVIPFSDSSYEENLEKLGCTDPETPSSVYLYASTFESKDIIKEEIEKYNESAPEGQEINYTDYVGLIMSSVTTIINAISYVLIGFVAVSLVVSSIMIGVITLISVQERTKEIGILRAIGASKRNVSSLFNAETVIIGFLSGVIGVGITYLLCLPINLILHALTDIEGLGAYLPPQVACVLVLISVLLTLISGIIPSRSAAKKDPVVALRTE